MQQVPIAEQPLGENIILNSLSLSLSMCLLHGLRGVLSDVVFDTTIIHFVWSKIEYNVTSFLISMQRERERDLSLILRQRIDQIGVQHVPLIDDLTARYFVVSIDLICMTMLNRCQQLYFGVLGGLNDKVILDKIMSHL